ncbi:MAG: hypothetical protein V1925_05570 [Candidatus Omnitrophota bacterium]
MGISVFIARLLGPYCIIVAIGILFNLKTYQRLVEDFCKNLALVYLGGVISLFFGLLLVLFHNIWAFNWVVIITIIGWLGILKGIWLIVFPNTVAAFTKAYQKNIVLLRVHLVIIFALGACLAFFGYFAG